MKKYTVKVVAAEVTDCGAFVNINLVPDFVEFDDGENEVYEFYTECDLDRALDLSDGVVSYTVISCYECDEEFKDDGDLCPACAE